MTQLVARSIHLQLFHVRAAPDRSSVSAVAAYIADEKSGPVSSVEAVLSYLAATGRHKVDSSRVAAVEFRCRGDFDRDRVWRQLDASFRTKGGDYSCRGGNRHRKGSVGQARLAIFGDLTLPRELSEKQKIAVARDLRDFLIDTYGCAVELSWHLKDNKIDHFHILISTKIVDSNGVGAKIREFNGIHSKCAETAEDGVRVAMFVEKLRRRYAELLTAYTGVLFDWRSFERQGRTEKPARHIPRGTLYVEAKMGTNRSMAQRKALLAARAGNRSIGNISAHEGERKISVQPMPTPQSARPDGSVAPAAERALSAGPHQAPIKGLSIVEALVSAGRTKTASPAPPSGVARSGRSLADARSDDERAEIIRQNVDDDLRADAANFVREQQIAEEKRRMASAFPKPGPGPLANAFNGNSKHQPTVRLRRHAQSAEASRSEASELETKAPEKTRNPPIDERAGNHDKVQNLGQQPSSKEDVVSQVTLLYEGGVDNDVVLPRGGTRIPAIDAKGKKAPSQASSPTGTPPPAMHDERLVHDITTGKANKPVKAKPTDHLPHAVCVQACAYSFRFHQTYRWEEELAELAGMELLAFRVAVNALVQTQLGFTHAQLKSYLNGIVARYPVVVRYLKRDPSKYEPQAAEKLAAKTTSDLGKT